MLGSGRWIFAIRNSENFLKMLSLMYLIYLSARSHGWIILSSGTYVNQLSGKSITRRIWKHWGKG